MKHIPVLLHEVLELLDPKPKQFVIDGTVDGGGHALEIISRLQPGGMLLGVEWDKKMLEVFDKRIGSQKSDVRVVTYHGNYARMEDILREQELEKADGLLLDLGFSSEQLEVSSKGFSFLKDEPLDMRYGDTGETAAEVLNSFREDELADIFSKYGEERFSRRIAQGIVVSRRHKRIVTTSSLVEVIKDSISRQYERGRIHPATRVFQALRIYVNRELENLEVILGSLEHILKPCGRAVIISFHSLEDRMVKMRFKDMERKGVGRILTKKPIKPSKEEVIANPRSRSAKLRAIEVIT